MDNMFVKSKKKARVFIKHAANIVKEPSEFLPKPMIVADLKKQPHNIPTKSGVLTRPIMPPKKASWWKRLSKKKRLIILIPTVTLLIGGVILAYFMTKKEPVIVKVTPAPIVEKIVEPPKPTTEASKLTGTQVAFDLNKRGVTAIMIENSMDARPQSGLLTAGIVHEAIAEGGITRFLALFQEAQPDYIGPVRSARPYYIDWLMPYSPTYAHAGGSPEALSMITSLGIKDMNEFVNSGAYQRVSNRFAPHNLYTTMANLDAIRTKNNWGNPDFVGLLRKADAPAKLTTATSIDFKISSALYNVHYDYNLTTNSYNRSEGGKPHIDERSSTQLSPKVVIAMVVPYSIHPDGVHSKYQTIGSGQAYIYQDGIMQNATWSKPTQSSQISFKDAAGQPIGLNTGQTWITAVGLASMVTFSGSVAATPAAP
ncbi:MAG: DUF3048 domain-containing protein [bacterium]